MVEQPYQDIHLFISARGLKDLEIIGVSDPICLVHEQDPKKKTWAEVARTDIKKNDLNPDWGYIKMKYYFEKKQNLRFEIRDTDMDKPSKPMGYFEVTMGKIMGSKAQMIEVLLKDAGNNTAGLVLRAVTMDEAIHEETAGAPLVAPQKDPQFTDFLRGGWQINCAVAIDYTASNGTPDDEDSLHFMGPKNQYEAVIKKVGAVIEPYDFDKLYPVYGFGGIPAGQTKVMNSFPLNGNDANPMVNGIEGVLGIYRQTLPHIKLSGPTYFGSVLEKFKAHCQHQAGKTNWNVLLIITDGFIHDMEKTKSLLVELSELPASVIIVAVGEDEELEQMYELDGDKNKLVDANGKGAVRDCVQFVEYLKIKGEESKLNEVVLGELPNQFMQYMKANNVTVTFLPQDMNQFPHRF